MAMIAFECMTGERAFEGASLGALFLKIVQAPIPVPSKVVAARAKETGAEPIQLLPGHDVLMASHELEGGAVPQDTTVWLRQAHDSVQVDGKDGR